MPTVTGAHRRLNRSLLAESEKRLLIAIARRLPPSINSDHLSGLALTSMLVVGTGFAIMRVAPAGVLLVIAGLLGNWFGDSLDGTVARVRGHERPRFGYYVDHVIDLAGTAALFAGLACSDLMTASVAMAVLAGYFLVSAEVYLATHAAGIFRMSCGGIGPTELRILVGTGALYATWRPVVLVPWLGAERLFDVGGAIALVGFGVVFVVSGVRQTRDLYRLEPRPHGIPQSPRAGEPSLLPVSPQPWQS